MPPKGGLSIKIIQLEHSCVLALSFEALLQVMGPKLEEVRANARREKGKKMTLYYRITGTGQGENVVIMDLEIKRVKLLLYILIYTVLSVWSETSTFV